MRLAMFFGVLGLFGAGCGDGSLYVSEEVSGEELAGQNGEVSAGTSALTPRGEGELDPVTDPFDPASCDGAAMTFAEAAGRFLPGQTQVYLGRWQIVARTRSCNAVTGCGAWGTFDRKNFYNEDGGPHVVVFPVSGGLSLQVSGSTIVPRLVSDPQSRVGATYNMWTRCSSVAAPALGCTWYGSWGLTPSSDPRKQWKINLFGTTGDYRPVATTLTNSCVRLRSFSGRSSPTASTWNEFEMALLGRF